MKNEAIDFMTFQCATYMPFDNNYIKKGQLWCISHKSKEMFMVRAFTQDILIQNLRMFRNKGAE